MPLPPGLSPTATEDWCKAEPPRTAVPLPKGAKLRPEAAQSWRPRARPAASKPPSLINGPASPSGWLTAVPETPEIAAFAHGEQGLGSPPDSRPSPGSWPERIRASQRIASARANTETGQPTTTPPRPLDPRLLGTTRRTGNARRCNGGTPVTPPKKAAPLRGPATRWLFRAKPSRSETSRPALAEHASPPASTGQARQSERP